VLFFCNRIERQTLLLELELYKVVEQTKVKRVLEFSLRNILGEDMRNYIDIDREVSNCPRLLIPVEKDLHDSISRIGKRKRRCSHTDDDSNEASKIEE